MRTALAVAAVAATCGCNRCRRLSRWRRQAEDAAANYPSFPIKIVVPYPAGSIPDTLGRMIGDQLQTQFGKPVVVEIAPAPARCSAPRWSSAEPDGYTLLIRP